MPTRKNKELDINSNKELSFPKPDVFVEKDLKTQWPDDFFDLFGAWEGEPLVRLVQDENA